MILGTELQSSRLYIVFIKHKKPKELIGITLMSFARDPILFFMHRQFHIPLPISLMCSWIQRE